jgi:hypothetical protein
LSVSTLLSEQDAITLHKHFVSVEIGRVNSKIEKIESGVREFSEELVSGPTWPIGASPPVKPPNRYQVPVWEYFTDLEIFKNEPNQNTKPLTGNDAIDIREVVVVARNKVEIDLEDGNVPADEIFDPNTMEFVKLRNGYRLFNALRGMEYYLVSQFKISETK